MSRGGIAKSDEKEKVTKNEKMKKHANMTEFAKSLGLSRSTVSYILNGKWESRNISRKTAGRVLEYAEKARFRPNIFSQAMRGKISTDVAILLPSNAFEHHKQAFFEFIRVVRENSLSYLVFPLNTGDDNFETITLIKSYRVKRVVVISTSICSVPGEFDWWCSTTCGLPEVEWLFYDCFCAQQNAAALSPNISLTGFDRIKGYRQVFNFIRERGYTGMLCGGFCPNQNLLEYIRSTGLDYLGREPIEPAFDLFQEGSRLAGKLIVRDFPRHETAIFISDDTVAIGAIASLREKGFAVPGDFNIVSWDGLPISKYVSPPLATLEIPVAGMVEAVASFMTGRPFERIHRLAATLRPGNTLPFRK